MGVASRGKKDLGRLGGKGRRVRVPLVLLDRLESRGVAELTKKRRDSVRDVHRTYSG